MNNRRGENRPSEGERRERTIYPIGYKVIEDLCQRLDSKELLPGSTDLIRNVTSQAFTKRLDELWPQDDRVANFLNVIVKAISHSQSELSVMTHEFIDNVLASSMLKTITDQRLMKLYGRSYISETSKTLLNHLIQLMTSILNRKPHAVDQFFPQVATLKMFCAKYQGLFDDVLETNLNTLADIVDQLLEQKAKMVTTEKSKPRLRVVDAVGLPPNDFRQISVAPTKEDMLFHGKPYLRKNISHGRYEDSDHYLDVQFRLLREDLLAPLRAGVRDYSSAALKNAKHGDVYVYQDVYIGFPRLDKMSGDMVCLVTFRTRRCRWLRQMKGGSLVVLSKDGFREDFVFGTIQNRQVKELDKGLVQLLFENLNLLDHESAYQMIESSAYYEAYKHVLRGLQSFSVGENIPFHQYLVEVNTSPGVPSYLVGNEFKIDFGVICGSENEEERRTKLMDVRLAHEQLQPAEIGLDSSQHRALTMAFSQELVVIQGPPGTGKTHVGHQISRVLLANQNLWNPDSKHPMLVVCYTNHALDQFLNGILKFMEVDGTDEDVDKQPMIRVGSRSNDPTLAKYNLNELRRNSGVKISMDLIHRRREAYNKRKDVMRRMAAASESLTALKDKIVELSKFLESKVDGETVISAAHAQQFRACVTGKKLDLNDVFIEWLTRTNRPNQNQFDDGGVVQMDLHLINKLMGENYPELLAKNLAFLCKNNYEEIGPFFYLNAVNRYHLMNEPLPEVRLWPSVHDMITLIETFGVREQEAYEALRINGTLERAAEMIARTIEQNVIEQFERMEVYDEQEFNWYGDEDANSELDLLDEYERERAEDLSSDDDVDQPRRPGGVEAEVEEEAVGLLDVHAARGADVTGDDGEGWQIVGRSERNERVHRLEKETPRILSSEPCTEEFAANLDDIWQLPVRDRRRLYKHWTNKLAEKCHADLRKLEDEYSRLTYKLSELKLAADGQLLQSARVLGMTTTGAAKLQPVLKTVNCPVVIIEEAAEVLEAHIVTALTVNCKHVILIGDHKQLRPNPEVYALAKDYALDISLFERLINNKFPYTMLQNQHRMRTEIARALMPHFYEDLRDDPSVFKYEPIVGMTKSFAFINHAHPEKDNSEQDQRSHMNEFEGEYSVMLARYLLQQGYRADQVTILCTYMEQMLFVRRRALAVLGEEHHVRIEVVDNYQGEECDIIILSFVRSLNEEGKIGFLNVQNRVCVALSRAKMGLYCLGNIDFLAEKCALWKNIRASLVEHEALSNSLEVVCQGHGNSQVINTWQDFIGKTANGGCHLPCTYRLDCGHACTQLCHPTLHDTVICSENCGRSCPVGHPCKKKCYIECGDCAVIVEATLPCGHNANKRCHEDVNAVECPSPCPLKLACGHNCLEQCSEPCTESCEEMVVKPLRCGHSMMMRCYEDPANTRCERKVEKEWSGCGHRLTVECHVDPTVSGCPHPCAMTLPGCDHKCKGTCSGCRRGRLHVRCDEKCERVLICGHVCGSKCSTTCPPCEKPCETACFHSKCSTNFTSAYQSQTCRPMFGQKRKIQGRKCGEVCPPCLQPCANYCFHDKLQAPCIERCEDREHCKVVRRACDQICVQQCNVEPCNERCDKFLECGHRCLGLCGEDCPDMCKQCVGGPLRAKYNESSETFLGMEDDEDALFIKLTCGHCIESQGMDGWVKSQLDGSGDGETHSSSAIVQITCPKCRSPLQKSRRYQRELTQRMLDIETVKSKIIAGTPLQLNGEREQILAALNSAIDIDASMHCFEQLKWLATVKVLKDAITKTKKEHLTKVMVTHYGNAVEFMRKFKELLEELDVGKLPNNKNAKLIFPKSSTAAERFFGTVDIESKLKSEWNALMDFLKKHLFDTSASVLMYEQFGNELTRLERSIELGKLLLLSNKGGEISDLAVDAIADIGLLLNRSVASDSESLEEFKRLMQVVNSGFGISYEEKMEIKRALRAVVSAWYKCPNGHLYGIGECGGAMVEARCPECKAVIGGEDHRLRGDNQPDDEMTGGRFG